jgi:hypothetical protein
MNPIPRIEATTASVADDNIDFARVPDRPLVTAAGAPHALERGPSFWTDQRDLLLASMHILGIVGRLAWRKEIRRRRIMVWARAFLGGWFSRRLNRIVPDTGFCFRAPGPRRVISDQEGSSILILLENGSPLAAPHTSHDEIRRLGRGGYSHWGRYIYFSSSDNTDPRNNGRVYTLVQRM